MLYIEQKYFPRQHSWHALDIENLASVSLHQNAFLWHNSLVIEVVMELAENLDIEAKNA